MPKPKGGLGRGLNSLIPQGRTRDDEAVNEAWPEPVAVPPQPLAPSKSPLAMLPVGSISPNPHQPRQAIYDAELEQLASSIREHGVLQPLVVARAGSGGKYNLVAGERRWRAAMLAGLEEIPALIKEASSREMLEWALVENLQRSDLNPIEEADAYKSLVDEFGLRQEDVARRVGKSREAVANSLRLLKLPPAVQESVVLGLITAGHARAILQVPDEEQQIRLLEHTVAEDLSVRQVEELARSLTGQGEPKKKERKPKERPLYDEMNEIAERFQYALGTKVKLSRSRREGKLVIYFYSEEELGRIYGAIVGEEG